MNNVIYNEADWKKWEARLVIRDIGINKTYTPFYWFLKYAAKPPAECPWPTEFVEYADCIKKYGCRRVCISKFPSFFFTPWESWFAASNYHQSTYNPYENCGNPSVNINR